MTSKYSQEQLSLFLAYIGLPPDLRQQRCSGVPENDRHLLEQLHTHFLSSIPYENLSIHYSATHKVSIDPQVVFNKTVTDKRGRGGYCMENSIMYHHILLALGFSVYMSAVRIRRRIDGIPQGDYSGWVHIVNIVTLSDGSKYVNDVGFGGDGPTAPLSMDDSRSAQLNLGVQENRLVRDWIPSQTYRTESNKMWIYQYRNGDDKEWNSFYAFPEVEAMEADFGVVNWYTGHCPTSFQTFTQLIVKFLRRPKNQSSPAGDQEIYGKRMLVNTLVKENLGGKTQVVAEFHNERERVAGLKEFFGIDLTDSERLGIQGWSSELK